MASDLFSKFYPAVAKWFLENFQSATDCQKGAYQPYRQIATPLKEDLPNAILFHLGGWTCIPKTCRHGARKASSRLRFEQFYSRPKESASGSDGYEMFKTRGFGRFSAGLLSTGNA